MEFFLHAGNGGMMKQILKTLLHTALFITVTVLLGTAIHAVPPINEVNTPSAFLDGWEYEGRMFTIQDRAYVSLREFSCAADNSVISWDSLQNTAHVKTDSLTLTARDGAQYIEANERILWCEYSVFTMDGVLYVPLRQIAKAFDFDIEYVAESNSVHLTRKSGALQHALTYYNEEELYWLSKIIHAESQGEPFIGKVAVGNVIMNRVDSAQFPDSVYDVIFDQKNGVQFSPTVNGAIHQQPNADSVRAAKACLDNAELSDEILYFLNQKIATSFWIVNNCRFVMTIGSHTFYA